MITLLETDNFVVTYNPDTKEYIITHFDDFHWDGEVHILPNGECWEE